MSIVLFVDEETQGSKSVYQSVDELKADLEKLLDESLLEVSIKRKGIADSNPIPFNS